MEVTEVRLNLLHPTQQTQRNWLLAYVSVIFDHCFCVREMRVIEGKNGKPFVVFPSRKITDHCGYCGKRNPLLANYCNWCGAEFREVRGPEWLIVCPDCPDDTCGHCSGGMSRPRIYEDILFPINSQFRDKVKGAVMEAYMRELNASGSVLRLYGTEPVIAATRHDAFASGILASGV